MRGSILRGGRASRGDAVPPRRARGTTAPVRRVGCRYLGSGQWRIVACRTLSEFDVPSGPEPRVDRDHPGFACGPTLQMRPRSFSQVQPDLLASRPVEFYPYLMATRRHAEFARFPLRQCCHLVPIDHDPIVTPEVSFPRLSVHDQSCRLLVSLRASLLHGRFSYPFLTSAIPLA